MNVGNNHADERCADNRSSRPNGAGKRRDSGNSQGHNIEIKAADLLNQQIWCWGQDIEYPRGNLLLRHGFQRIEKPPGSHAVSIYRLDISPTARVILRGFGVFYGDDRWGGMFLRRFGFSPRRTPGPDLPLPVWTVDDLPPTADPRDEDAYRGQRLVLDLIDWIRRYEVWIVENVGLDYRRESLVPWRSKAQAITPAEEMAREWRWLGVAIAEDFSAWITRCRAPRSHPNA